MKRLMLTVMACSFLWCANSIPIEEQDRFKIPANGAAGHCNKVLIQDGAILELEGCFILFEDVMVMQNTCLPLSY